MKYYIYKVGWDYVICSEQNAPKNGYKLSDGADNPSDLYDELRELKSSLYG